MKRFIKWIIWILLSPVLLFLTLSIILYIPAVQNFAVKNITRYISENTQTQVSISSLRLSFPLDLNIQNFQMHDRSNGLLLGVESLIVDLKLSQLFQGRIDVEGITLLQGSVNTKKIIPGVSIQGELGRFFISSHGIDLAKSNVKINQATLEDSKIQILLNDSVSEDTTTSAPLNWIIYLDEMAIRKSGLHLSMPGDTLHINAGFQDAVLREGTVDLQHNIYSAQTFSLLADSAAYHLTTAPHVTGADFNHLVAGNIRIGIDSIRFNLENSGLKANIKEFSLKEKSGLKIDTLIGKIDMDTAHIAMSQLLLKTPDSHIEGHADIYWSALDTLAAQPERLDIRLIAQIGKQDLLLFGGELPKNFVQHYPNHPLFIYLSANGNLQQLDLHRAEMKLPGAFTLKADGKISDPMQEKTRKGQVQIALQTQNLNFLKSLFDPNNQLAIPGITFRGNVGIDGSNFHTEFLAQEQNGAIRLKGSYNTAYESYQATLKVENLNLTHFMPKDSLYQLSLNAHVKGRGFDPLSRYTTLNGNVVLDSLQYGNLMLSNIQLNAELQKGEAAASLTGETPLFDINTQVKALLSRKMVNADLQLRLEDADLYALHVSPAPLKASMNISFNGNTNMKDRHEADAHIGNLVLSTPDSAYNTKDLTAKALIYPDTTYAYLNSGDMLIRINASEGYESILRKSNDFLSSLNKQIEQKHIVQDSLRMLLPDVTMKITSGRDNPIINYLSAQGYNLKDLVFNLKTNPQNGLNGGGHIYNLNTGGILIDTIRTSIFQDSTGVKIKNLVKNGPKNKQIVFEALLNAHVEANGAGVSLTYYDEKKKKGVDIGIMAHIEDSGTRFTVFPQEPILAYRKFKLNADNFLYLGHNGKLMADIDLLADDQTGIQVYTTPTAEENLQDITVSLSHINLKELTSVIPYAPNIGGMLKGDIHMLQSKESMSLSSELGIKGMSFENAPLGDIGMSLIYLPEGNARHVVEGSISQNQEEIVSLYGTYNSEAGAETLDANMELVRFPLSMVNGFIPEKTASLNGYAAGHINISGNSERPKLNGKLRLDAIEMQSKEYSLVLRIQKDSIELKDNMVLFNQMNLYAQNNNPLTLNGKINLKELDNAKLDLNIKARNFELINAPRTKEATAYGRVMVDVNTALRGDMNNLTLQGQLNVLGNTDVTYILKDSPLTVEDRLSDLVTFVDFSDTTAIAPVEKPHPMNIDMVMILNIDQAAQVHCLLSPDRSHYIDLEGGGSLTMSYSPDNDIRLNGRYEVISGEMRYSLPIIPLKTFTIKSGSYVEFTGNIMNPRLNLAATERVRTSVIENETPRTVSFDVGIAISQTLENMGLEFTLEAPEDMNVQNELASMSVEQRGRLAVTMLATGMYLANNNTSSFSTSNALNAYLQSEISKISGKALKTIDLSIGMENSTSSTGANQTDYSFQFAKRFWGNRISVIIGGKVSTGNDVENTGETLIDNVSVEYRLDNSATRYVKVFYDKGYESLLEGEITEMGAGLVLRKKMNRLGELFIFKRREEKKKDAANMQ